MAEPISNEASNKKAKDMMKYVSKPASNVSNKRTLYPPIQPFEKGLLDVGDGHQLSYDVSGNPDGLPAIFLHGGP